MHIHVVPYNSLEHKLLEAIIGVSLHKCKPAIQEKVQSLHQINSTVL